MNVNNRDDIYRLLKEKESEWLDFKKSYHENKSSLIHDILCLANSDADSDRFLVFGIDEAKNNDVTGINDDQKRLKQADLYDLLDNSNFNIVPSIKLYTFEIDNGIKVDILEIKNKPEKPYFLTKDKTVHGKTVRAGVVYSRLGDRNTPINSCVDDKKLERMFLERFSLHLTPSERFKQYIQDAEGWNRRDGYNAFYERHPEFTIAQEVSDGDHDRFSEPWVKTFPDTKAYRDVYNAKYFNTKLERILVISCDGGRYQCVLPSHRCDENEKYGYRFYYHIRDTHQYNMHNFFNAKTIDTRVYREPFALLKSEFEVVERFKEAKNGNYCDGMYLFDKATRKFMQYKANRLWELKDH